MALRCGIVFWAIIRDLAELAFPPLHFFDIYTVICADIGYRQLQTPDLNKAGIHPLMTAFDVEDITL